MATRVAITTFYRFQPLPEPTVEALKTALENMAANHQVHGLCLLGREGINGTGVVHVGSGPGTIGGPAKNFASIGGTNFRR